MAVVAVLIALVAVAVAVFALRRPRVPTIVHLPNSNEPLRRLAGAAETLADAFRFRRRSKASFVQPDPYLERMIAACGRGELSDTERWEAARMAKAVAAGEAVHGSQEASPVQPVTKPKRTRKTKEKK